MLIALLAAFTACSSGGGSGDVATDEEITDAAGSGKYVMTRLEVVNVPSSQVVAVCEFAYNDNYQMIREDYDGIPADGTINRVTYFEYDGSGRMAHKDIDYLGGMDRYSDFTYDASGNLISETGLINSDAMPDTITFTYNGGRLFEKSVDYSNNASTDFLTNYYYDAAGNLERESTNGPSGPEDTQWLYYYEAGRLDYKELYQGDPLLLNSTWKYYYDENGNQALYVIDSSAGTTEYRFTWEEIPE